jgi:type IV pilus assembly protein PilB
MFEGHDQAISELLAEQRLVATTGQSLARTVVELGLIDPAVLMQAIARHLGCASADRLPDDLPSETVSLADADFVRSRGVVPIKADETVVSFVAVNPFAPNLAEDVGFTLGREARLLVADPERVQALIRRHYGGEAALDDVMHGLTEQSGGNGPLSDTDLEKLAGHRTSISSR